MKSKSGEKISGNLVNYLNKDMIFELAKRLEDDNYAKSFDGLKDWHLIALAINRPELTSEHINFVDQEPFDEN